MIDNQTANVNPDDLDDLEEEEIFDELAKGNRPLVTWQRPGDGTVDHIDVFASPLSLEEVRSVVRTLTWLAEELAGELRECEPWCTRTHATGAPCSRVYGYACTEQDPEARIAREAFDDGVLHLVGPTYQQVEALQGDELRAAARAFMRAAYDLDSYARTLEDEQRAGEAA
ncbi:hypothetical protein [Actinomyces faecalis]|uniref:hypothetical protein n=1 Tax=Actinomyces faecalis TaxID=2722820 RepID=UPI0015569A9B|nr:hypothetical protein [Actinomyces faecalis]